MKSLLFLIYAFMFSILHAGDDGTCIIKGKSGTGRTQVEIHTTDIDEGIQYIKFTIDGKSYEFKVGRQFETYGYIIHDRKNKIFTVTVDNTQILFQFWMIPKSKKVISQTGTSAKWKFKAYIEATDPRKFTDKTRNDPISPKIELNCTLDYSL